MIDETPIEVPPPPRTRRGPMIAFVLLGAVVVLSVAANRWYARALDGTPGGALVAFVVEPGDTARTITDGLEERGIIRSAFAMRLHLQLNGLAADLKPGVYELTQGLGVGAALEALLEGVPLETVRFTIPEGKTISEIADIVNEHTAISRAEFLAEAKPKHHRPRIIPQGVQTLEGLLFPDTYEIEADASVAELVQMLVDRFDEVFAGLPGARAKQLGISKYEAVVVASLIECEARIQKDRPLIASVIYNRLEVPMKLQIDATVTYALLGRERCHRPGVVLFEDLEIDSPFNTYRIDGLPPTPIAAPGRAALLAALKPADTQFLYYVACGTAGGHAFGRTGSDHQRNIERCR